MKTPNHPSSVVTPLVISQQSNMTEIKTLISQLDAIKIEPNVLKCFSLRQIYIIKKSVEDEKNSISKMFCVFIAALSILN